MTINQHDLDGRTASGNGHHGHCSHCGVALVTDLGYDSWAGLKCKDRPVTRLQDFPDEIRSYVNFNSMHFDPINQTFAKPYDKGKKYTVKQIVNKVNELTGCTY